MLAVCSSLEHHAFDSDRDLAQGGHMKVTLLAVAVLAGVCFVGQARAQSSPAPAASAHAVLRCVLPSGGTLYTNSPKKALAEHVTGCVSTSPRWRFVTGSSGIVVFVDTKTLRRTGSTATVWVRFAFAKPKTMNDLFATTYHNETSLVVYNCKERTVTYLEQIFYQRPDGTGYVANSHTFPEYERTASAVIPQSLGEAVLEYVCRKPAPAAGR